MTTPPAQSLPAVRAATSDDREQVLRLLSASLGWVPNDLFAAFFAWKHEQNPAGSSPAWVALGDDAEIIGFRTFLRWGLEGPGGVTVAAVRAVDTATHPDHQGRGIFRLLTNHALDELRAEGADLVFNTPNDRSRPGYLSMGWSVVGALAPSVRPTSPAGFARMVRSRVPADRWSAPSRAGVPATEVLTGPVVEALLASQAPPRGLRTRRTLAHLRWRYGFDALHYRAVALGSDPAEGLAIFRIRRRGAATEAALCEVMVPAGNTRAAVALERAVVAASKADYVIRLGGPRIDGAGFIRLPGQGPVLTRRSVPEVDGGLGVLRSGWDLDLGDVELF